MRFLSCALNSTRVFTSQGQNAAIGNALQFLRSILAALVSYVTFYSCLIINDQLRFQEITSFVDQDWTVLRKADFQSRAVIEPSKTTPKIIHKLLNRSFYSVLIDSQNPLKFAKTQYKGSYKCHINSKLDARIRNCSLLNLNFKIPENH